MLSMCAQIRELAQKEGAQGVATITVRIGELAGVEFEAFSFAFEVYKKQDPFFAQAHLKIEKVPARLRCLLCGHETQAQGLTPCPACGQWGLEPITGKELDLLKVELILPEEGKDHV